MSDSLASLRTALAPKAAMKRIPFPTESYQHLSVPLSAKRLLNVMAESQPQDARTPIALVPTAGLDWVTSFPAGGPVAALNVDLIGGYYAVSGWHAYRNDENGTFDLGVVGSPVEPTWPANYPMISIAVSPFAVVICSPPNLFTAPHGTNVLTPVDMTNFPSGGANSITFIDGYFVATQSGRGTTFNVSGLQNPNSWDALDFANVEGMDNILLKALWHRNELWLLGRAAIEIWYDAGKADFPFRRQSGGVIPYGVIPQSVARVDGSVWWVAPEGVVFRSQGYQPQRVSTHAIEAMIDAAGADTASAAAYMHGGHAFYALTLGGTRTVVYDAGTQFWHDRSSGVDGTGRWRVTCTGTVNNDPLAGDTSGNIYSLNPLGTTDSGVPIFRQATLPPLFAGTQRGFCHRLEVEMEVGSTPPVGPVTLEWSDDGGITWTGTRTMSGGASGQYRQRVYTTRLGSFRDRVFRITTSGRATLYAVDAFVETSQAAFS
jgi:hypothetical protein